MNHFVKVEGGTFVRTQDIKVKKRVSLLIYNGENQRFLYG